MAEVIYGWHIRPNLSVVYDENNLQNVVNQVVWSYQADYIPDGVDTPSISKSIRGNTNLPTPDVNNFIPFENLTEQTVINWVTASISSDTILDMQQKLSSSISNDLIPTTGIVQAPWV